MRTCDDDGPAAAISWRMAGGMTVTAPGKCSSMRLKSSPVKGLSVSVITEAVCAPKGNLMSVPSPAVYAEKTCQVDVEVGKKRGSDTRV